METANHASIEELIHRIKVIEKIIGYKILYHSPGGFNKKTVESLDFSKWHHVMAVQDGIEIKLYVDGIKQNLTDEGIGNSPGDWFADMGINNQI